VIAQSVRLEEKCRASVSSTTRREEERRRAGARFVRGVEGMHRGRQELCTDSEKGDKDEEGIEEKVQS